MRVGRFEDPLPNLAPALLPLPGPHLLQAAGVQLGFIDDLDGDLETEERGERSRYHRPSSWERFPQPRSP